MLTPSAAFNPGATRTDQILALGHGGDFVPTICAMCLYRVPTETSYSIHAVCKRQLITFNHLMRKIEHEKHILLRCVRFLVRSHRWSNGPGIAVWMMDKVLMACLVFCDEMWQAELRLSRTFTPNDDHDARPPTFIRAAHRMLCRLNLPRCDRY